MNVIYCDLCSNPIKGKKWRMQWEKYSLEAEFTPLKGTFSQVEKEKEVCPTCKLIIDQIFKKRMVGVIKLASDLKTIYEMPVKIPTQKKDNEKKNKKKKT